jgi:hypothetical protein
MIVALLGIVISFFAYLIAFPRPDQRRFDIYLALFALHIVMAIAYWLYHFDAAMDAFTYYRDPYNYYDKNPLADGTYFVVYFVQTIKRNLGGSFLDHFLLFQCFGMIGFALLIRSFTEVAESLSIRVPFLVYAVLFIPGMHFWSVAIGKDGPIFMAVALACWASIRLQKRFVWLVVAMLVMAAIRPHVAAITMLASMAGFVMANDVPRFVRMLMIPLAGVGLVVTLVVSGSQLGLDFSSAGSVTEFIEYQQGMATELGSGRDITSLPFPLKVFTLLFRPLFLDASGVMGLVASAENVVFLFVFGSLAFYWRTLLTLLRRVYYMIFCAVFSSTLIVGLSLINYNLGLGQRQKMMVMPAVLLMYASVFLYRRYLAAVAAQARAQAYAQAVEQAQAGAQVPGAAYGQPSQA